MGVSGDSQWYPKGAGHRKKIVGHAYCHITKFSSQTFSYTHRKFHFGAVGADLCGPCPTALPPSSPLLVIISFRTYGTANKLPFFNLYQRIGSYLTKEYIATPQGRTTAVSLSFIHVLPSVTWAFARGVGVVQLQEKGCIPTIHCRHYVE